MRSVPVRKTSGRPSLVRMAGPKCKTNWRRGLWGTAGDCQVNFLVPSDNFICRAEVGICVNIIKVFYPVLVAGDLITGMDPLNSVPPNIP